jgi:uncharacterized RDD family membrane protein YckC
MLMNFNSTLKIDLIPIPNLPLPTPMRESVQPMRIPRVPLWRRTAAWALDFLGAWIFTSFATGTFQAILFVLFWLFSRVLVVTRTQGQSLGRWAFDMRVISTRMNRTPGLIELTKRESVLGLESMLVMLALTTINPTNGGGILLLLPIAFDFGFALSDPQELPTLHDRWAATVVVASRRGYSLDLKIKRLLAQGSRRMR